MEIKKTFIVNNSRTNYDVNYIKVYLSNNIYFEQKSNGSIFEISKEDFDKYCKQTI